MFSKYKFSFLTLIYAAGILWFSLQPDYSTGAAGSGLRQAVKNFLHIPAYAGLAGLMVLTFVEFRRGGFQTLPYTRIARSVLLWAFIIATAYGILNEFVQAHVPGRFYSVSDMIRNAIGAGIGIWVVRKIIR